MNLAFYILPVVMLIAGVVLLLAPTKKPNSIYGFRTKTSSKNEQTWEYCNRSCAKVLIVVGLLSVITIFATGKVTAAFFGLLSIGEMVNILAIGIVLLSIPVINDRCRKKFPNLFYDENQR